MNLRRASLVLMLVLAVVVTGCSKKTAAAAPPEGGRPSQGSSGAGGSSALSEILGATAAAEEQGTVQMDFSMEMEGLGGSAPTGSGMDMGSFSFEGAADIDYANNASRTVMSMAMLGKMETIIVDDTMYIRSGMLSGLSGSNKKWVSAPVSQAGGSAMTSSMGGQDPAAMFAFLNGAIGLEEVGTEQVDGIDTTHYSGTIDVNEIMGNVPSDQQDQVKQALGTLGMGKIPFDVWVDGEGLVRKVELTMDFSGMSVPGMSPTDPGADALKNVKMVMTMTLHDYGAPVSIEAPPANQVAKMPNVPQGLPTP